MAAAAAGRFPIWFRNKAAEGGTTEVVAAGGRVPSVVAPPKAAIADVVTAGDRVPSVVDRRWGTCRI